MGAPTWNDTVPMETPAAAEPAEPMAGAAPTWEDTEDLGEKYGTFGQQLKAGAEGAAKGVLGPLAPLAETKLLGVKPEDIRGREEENPWISKGSEAAGFAGSMLTGVGEGALVTKAGEAAAHAAGLGLEGANLASKMAASGLRTATEMTMLQSGDEISKMIEQDPLQSLGSAAANIGLSGILGGVGGTAIGAIPPIWRAAFGERLQNSLGSIKTDVDGNLLNADQPQMRPIVKKLLATFGGVQEHDIDAYLANHEAINSAPGFSEIYDTVLDHIGKISDEVEAGKLAVGEAGTQFRELERSIKEDLRVKGFDAQVANAMASRSLKDAQAKLAYDLQQKALDAGKHVASATEALRNNVVEQSQEAYQALENSNKMVSLKPFFKRATDLMGELEQEGTLEAKNQAARVREYAQSVWKQFPEQLEIHGADAKALIQGLDKVSTYDFNATAFDKGLSRSYKQLRYTLDDTLKVAVPEYAEMMKPLAKDVQLLKALDHYGTEEDAIRRLKSIKNPDRLKSEFPLLEQLEKRTGAQFIDEIKHYAHPELREKLMRALPEFAEAEKTAGMVHALKDPRVVAELREALEKSAEFRTKTAAEEQLAGALAKKEEIKGVTPTTLQGKLNSVKMGKSIANKAMLENIKINGQSVPRLLELARMAEMFEKNATRGSKHVNLYGGVLGGLLGLAGGVHGLGAGAALGAGLGAGADNYGPQVVKKLLDRYIEHFGDLSKLSAENSPGAAKTLLTKVLGAGQAPNAEGFKAGADYISNVEKGDKLFTRAAKALFKGGAEILPERAMPKESDREKLDKKLKSAATDPKKLMGVGGSVGHYLPNHATQIAETAASAANYLNGLRPQPINPGGMLDARAKLPKSAMAPFNRALDIAEQPLMVVIHIKNGTLLPQDVDTLKAVYPGAYTMLSQKLTEQMTDHLAKDGTVPYKQRLGLSLFLGQPVDSTMTPMAVQTIMANNAAPAPPPVESQRPKKVSQSTANSMAKSASTFQTPVQAAASRRARPAA